jgi:hypothetical protein
MATVTFVGRQKTQRAVKTVTIGSSTAAQTFSLTAGPTRTVTYTAGSGETTTSIAAALWALAVAAIDGEFKELDWGATAPTTASFTVTGPQDGAPFDLTAGGTGTISVTATTAPLSPHDVADGANYSTGSLPSAADDLVAEETAASMSYNADALNAIALNSFTRKGTHTGRLGLVELNPAGYREYRPTRLSIDAPTVTIETTRSDAAESLKVLSVHTGTGVTAVIRGDGRGVTVGNEQVELSGLPAASAVDASRSSVAVCPLSGQTATVATLLGVNSTVRIGAGTTLTGPSLKDTDALIEASWSGTLTMNGGNVEINGAAAGQFVIEAGDMTWLSTGNPGASPVIGSDGTLDVSQAPKTLSISGTILVYKGGELDDSAGRAGNYALTTVHATLDEITWRTPNNKTFTTS